MSVAGRGGPLTLLLLHGMGANARVWDGVAALSSDTVLAPDLAGHGAGPRLPRYDFAAYARDVFERHREPLTRRPVRIVGHSMGGMVGLALAAMPEIDTLGVVALGVKSRWSDAEIGYLHRIADKGSAWFSEASAATERALAVSGLAGLVEPGSPAARAAVVCEGGRWRLALDPEVNRLTPPALAERIAEARCPVVLARGEHDAMAPRADLERFGCPVAELAGLGHNAHVEDPQATIGLLGLL